jgi:chemosensory pili system protein ChpC
MSDPLPREIRCVLVPVGEARMLLPNATIAEVVTHSAPEPIEGAPHWLLGRIAWRGWRVPLVSFTRLAGTAEGDSELVVRVAVLKALGGDPRLPFIAVQTQGFPRLTTLNSELIIPTPDGKGLPDGVRAHVLVRDDVAMIPDLEWIEANLLDLFDADQADPGADEVRIGPSDTSGTLH